MRKESCFTPLFVLTILLALASSAWAGKKSTLPIVRWAEQTPGCTFTRSDDGTYRWGLWTPDLGITVTIDSQELVQASKRIEKPLLLKLTFKYRGKTSQDIDPGDLSLEFVRHSHVIQYSLDPDDFSKKLEADAQALEDETQHTLKKHPEKKDEKEPPAQDYLTISTNFQDFVSRNTLRGTTLDSGNPEVTGWVMFSTKSKWIGEWKKQEQLILRIPFKDRVFEFPFSMPPTEDDLILRQRP
jgi:hypothetical protein